MEEEEKDKKDAIFVLLSRIAQLEFIPESLRMDYIFLRALVAEEDEAKFPTKPNSVQDVCHLFKYLLDRHRSEASTLRSQLKQSQSELQVKVELAPLFRRLDEAEARAQEAERLLALEKQHSRRLEERERHLDECANMTFHELLQTLSKKKEWATEELCSLDIMRELVNQRWK